MIDRTQDDSDRLQFPIASLDIVFPGNSARESGPKHAQVRLLSIGTRKRSARQPRLGIRKYLNTSHLNTQTAYNLKEVQFPAE
jgi:hypothetical protein